MILGDAVSKLQTFVWILNHILVSLHPKRIILGQMTNLNMLFHVLVSATSLPGSRPWERGWWCQFIDLLKFETRPSSLLNFGTAYSLKFLKKFYLLVLWSFATIVYLLHSTLSEQSRKGSLFSLFLFNPLVAFCYVCSIADLRSDLWDSCQRQVRRIMNDSLRVFYDWSRYVGESRGATLNAAITCN